jgi:hypothetical protein
MAFIVQPPLKFQSAAHHTGHLIQAPKLYVVEVLSGILWYVLVNGKVPLKNSVIDKQH